MVAYGAHGGEKEKFLLWNMYQRNSKARMHLTYTDSEIEKIRKKGRRGWEREKSVYERW